MSISNQRILIAGAFILPILVCFIGIGAFVHLATSFTHAQQQEQARFSRKMAEQKEASKVMKDKLAQLKGKISQLQRELREANARGEAEQGIESELGRLKSLKRRLEDELLALRQKVTKAQDYARSMNSLKAEVAQLKSVQEDLRARLESEKSKHKRLLSAHDAALREREKRVKVFSVTSLSGGSRHVRKAIFAECAADGIIVQPVKRRLSMNMEARDQNTFLSIVRQTRYVVFLIRPDGFESFRRYRALLISENRLSNEPIDIGFEPVNGDWVLIYPGQEGRVYARLDER